MNEKELYMKYKKKYLELKGGFIKNRNAIKIDIIRHKQCDNNDIVKFSPNFLKTLSDIHVTELSPVGDGEDKRRKKKEEDKEGKLEVDLGPDMFDKDNADEEDDDDDADDGEEEDDDVDNPNPNPNPKPKPEKKEGADDAKKKKGDDAKDEFEEDFEEVDKLGEEIEQLQEEIGPARQP